MSYYDYHKGIELESFCEDHDIPFAAMIQVAMRRSGSDELDKLRVSFPEIWEDLRTRYNAPGGMLPGEFPSISYGYNSTVEGDYKGEGVA